MNIEKLAYRFLVVLGVIHTLVWAWNLYHGCPPLGPICRSAL